MKTKPKPASRRLMQDIRPARQVRSKKRAKSVMNTLVRLGKFSAVFWCIVLVGQVITTLNAQDTKIHELETQIEERASSTFVVVPNGKEVLNVQKKGDMVMYKGVWVNSDILKKIDEKFGKDAETFKAILVVESSGGQHFINHNCRYDKAGNLKTDGTGYSNFCKSSYHAKIGTDSVDCGYLQLNFKGTQCPAGIFDADKQVAVAYEKYTSGGCGGLNCWSSYKYDRQKVDKVINK